MLPICRIDRFGKTIVSMPSNNSVCISRAKMLAWYAHAIRSPLIEIKIPLHNIGLSNAVKRKHPFGAIGDVFNSEIGNIFKKNTPSGDRYGSGLHINISLPSSTYFGALRFINIVKIRMHEIPKNQIL